MDHQTVEMEVVVAVETEGTGQLGLTGQVGLVDQEAREDQEVQVDLEVPGDLGAQEGLLLETKGYKQSFATSKFPCRSPILGIGGLRSASGGCK